MPRSAPAELSPRQHILTSAAEVFADKGFEGAGVDEIARRAGVNKAMLYYHVGDKATLYAQVLIANLDRVRSILEGALAQAEGAENRLRALVAAIAEAVSHTPAYPRLVLRELAGGGANLPREVLTRMAGLVELTAAVLAEGRTSGSFRAVDPVMTHLLIVAGVVVATTQPLRDRMAEAKVALPTIAHLPAVAPPDFLSDILLQGLRPRGAGGEL
jgi:AcrR family transcriptional regulator